MVLLLDKFVLGIDLDLSNEFSVLVLWVDLDLYNDLTVSVILILGASNVLLDACDFSVLLNVSIFFFAEIEVLMDYFTTFCFDLYFLSTMSLFPYLITVSVLVTNACLV